MLQHRRRDQQICNAYNLTGVNEPFDARLGALDATRPARLTSACDRQTASPRSSTNVSTALSTLAIPFRPIEPPKPLQTPPSSERRRAGDADQARVRRQS